MVYNMDDEIYVGTGSKVDAGSYVGIFSNRNTDIHLGNESHLKTGCTKDNKATFSLCPKIGPVSESIFVRITWKMGKALNYKYLKKSLCDSFFPYYSSSKKTSSSLLLSFLGVPVS